ncbi:cbb3-type cytochrome c oxidase subunit I, partial [Actinomadura fulvescens]|uniref:cbb3-type cytochrome c oxidase subunit I n=1 Tax=Actinomadura fulvescens TaxID=46160 RepID=UPI0031DD9E19
SGLYEPEPSADSFKQYYDDPTRAGIVFSIAWALLGMFVGVWVAALLAWPELTFVEQAWASFGRLRPIHTTGVIFGFGGNGLIATSFHVLQRTTRARLPDQISPWFVLLGYNLFCILAVTGYPIKHSRSPLIHGFWLREYGLQGSYQAMEVAPEDFASFATTLAAQNLVGGNVTLPHKEEAFKLCAKLDDAAKAIGAVNTLW